MGLTTEYPKYVPGGNVNLIADSNCNIAFVTLEGTEGKFVAVGACEHVYIWNFRTGAKEQVLSGDEANVTCLVASPNKRHIAVGYDDGMVKTFDLRSAENINTFVGHRSEVTCLAYDQLGHRLVSGSKDTDIIIWDVVAETGVCRLVGHKNIVTQVAFMKNHNILVSSSKDHLIKFWDIDNEFNFKTLVGHKSEVWGFALIKDDQYLISGCKDRELYIWKIYFTDKNEKPETPSTLEFEDEDHIDDMKYPLRCVRIGNIIRAGKGRLYSIVADQSGQVVGCHGTDNTIELFHFLPEEEIMSKKNKRINKMKKKMANDETLVEKLKEIEQDTVLRDQIKRLQVIKTPDVVKSLDLIMGRGDELRVCSVVDNNSIELHSITVTDKNIEPVSIKTISSHGHRSIVRAVCFSSDNTSFATASGDSVLIWNRPTLTCIGSIKCGYAVSIIFVPGDRHLIVGLKNGQMLIIDISARKILEEIPAHESELWSLNLWPENNKVIGVISGGGNDVKFWEFDIENETKEVTVVHTKTLKLEEKVVCVKISPNGRFVAVALLDCTVKIFFTDSFKFFVSLFGNDLPVLCMDISSDSTLIATGSADRKVKIWSLIHHGQCQNSAVTHDDSVTGVVFIPDTDYLFSCAKDGKVKMWNVTLQKLATLKGHPGQAFSCAISPNGKYLASCGSDKVVRIFEKGPGFAVLEDEAEMEREKQENELVTGETSAVQGQKNQILPSRKTVNTEKAAELVLECLDVCRAYKAECENVTPPNPMPTPPLLMQAYKCQTVEEYLLETVKRIRASDFDETMLLLPYSAACEILKMLPALLKSLYQAEIIVKLALSLIKAHHGPIVASQELLPQIEEIKSLTLKRVAKLRNTLGFNMYGMAYMQRAIEEKEGILLFREATKSQKKKNAKRKNKEKALKRAIMTM